jgi:ABC-2 type transport system permease protein
VRPGKSVRIVWLVVRREFLTTVGRKSFWLSTFLLPLALVILTVGMQALAQRSLTETGTLTPALGATTVAIGYVDRSGLLRDLPPDLPANVLRPFADEASAQSAVRRGDVSTYYLISTDYVRTGALSIVTTDYRPLAPNQVNPLVTYALNYGLTGDQRVAALLFDPAPRLETKSLAPAGEGRSAAGPLAFAVPYAALFILYLVLVMSGGFMLTSVSKEKENRTAEVLLVSLKARDLMLGKIVGLAGVGLLQMTIWLGVGLLGLSQARRMIESAGDFGLPAGFVPWTLAYFLLGFFLYAALFAMLGVMASSLRQANQLIYVAIIPLIIPLILATTLIEQPDGGLSVALSLIPLTSPVAMVTRLAGGSVPLWQLLAGLALLAIGAYGVVLLAARFFRVENLLSKQPFSWRRMAGQLRAGR